MASGDDQPQRRIRRRFGVEQASDEVGGHVVDADDRYPQRPRQGLRGADAHQQGTDETGTVPDRDRIELLQRTSGLLDGGAGHRNDALEVGAAGDLRHDARVLGVQRMLGRNDVAANVAAAFHDRRRGFVAARLQTKDERCLLRAVLPVAGAARPTCHPAPDRAA